MIRATVIGGGVRGYGDLREDLAVNTVPTKVQEALNAFDELTRNITLRKQWVMQAQTYMKNKGLYTKRIDGIWGTGSEGGFVSLAPEAERSLTRLADCEKIVRESGGRTELAAWIAAGISRDNWLRTSGGVTPEIDPRVTPRDTTANVPSTQQTDAYTYQQTDQTQDIDQVDGDQDAGTTEVTDRIVQQDGGGAAADEVGFTVRTTIAARKVFPWVATVLMGLGVVTIAGVVIWRTKGTKRARRR